MMPSATTAVASNAASLLAEYFQMTSRFSGSADFATPVPSTSQRTTGQSSAVIGGAHTKAPSAKQMMRTNSVRSFIQTLKILLFELNRIKFTRPLWRGVACKFGQVVAADVAFA